MRQKNRALLFDRMLGKLCVTMRMLGYDAKLSPEGETGRFLINAMKEGRTAVTRARNLPDRPGPEPVVLRSGDVDAQIVELFAATGDAPRFEPFTRCLECNTLLVEEPEEAVKGFVPERVARDFHRFHRCPDCRRVYWEGSHFQAMSGKVEEIKARLKKR